MVYFHTHSHLSMCESQKNVFLCANCLKLNHNWISIVQNLPIKNLFKHFPNTELNDFVVSIALIHLQSLVAVSILVDHF